MNIIQVVGNNLKWIHVFFFVYIKEQGKREEGLKNKKKGI